jgi:predicted ester cyclase
MSTMTATELVRRFYPGLFQDASVIDECIGKDYVDHNNEQGGRGPDAVRRHVAALRETFPDFSMQIVDIVAEGDRVVTRVTGQGTHMGVWMHIEPSGMVVNVKGINFDRVADGRIVEHWGEADTIGMLMQMGVDPFAGRIGRSNS